MPSEAGREGLEGETGRGGGGGGSLPATAAVVRLSLHSLAGWVPAPVPARPGKWVTEGGSSAPTLAKAHPARENRDHLPFCRLLSIFSGGFYICTLTFKIVWL